MRQSLLFALLFSSVAFAGEDTKQCKKDCVEFVTLCEKGCDSQLKKKDPKGKMVAACKKNCGDFVKQCEKGCDDGKF